MTDGSTPPPAIRVRKRDGSTESFEIAKVVNSIAAGLTAIGDCFEPDMATARALADLVRDQVCCLGESGPITTDIIADTVETVLTQSGYSEAGLVLRQFAGYRARQRRKLMVARLRPGDGQVVRHRWSKSRLVRGLQNAHRLDLPVSRMIAGRVEQLLMACGLQVVTTGLVAEMARTELLAWGLLPASLLVRPRAGQGRSSKVPKDR